MPETCTHCPQHCPAPAAPDLDLAGLPPVPRRGGGTGAGTTTDESFYRAVGRIYGLARQRHPGQPGTAVLRANPHVSRDQLRRAVARARVLGFLDPVRQPLDAPIPPSSRRASRQTAQPAAVPVVTHPRLQEYLDSDLGKYLDRLGMLPDLDHLVLNDLASDSTDAQVLRDAIRSARS